MHSVKLMAQVDSSEIKLTPLPEESSPALCRAGYFQFAAGQNLRSSCVQSRRLYWCKSGQGHFEINGIMYPLQPHDLYVLPWNRNIAHFADAQYPMFTGHVHLVPNYKPGSQWIPKIPHETFDVAFDSPDRSDALWTGFEGTTRLKIKTDEPIGLLLDYAIRWYIQTHGEDEMEGRYLGNLIVNELFRKRSKLMETPQDYPEELKRMLTYVDKGFKRSPTVSELAKLIGRSRSHVLKLFRKNLGTSPKSYIIDCQLQEARELLLSTTLRIAEVGQAVGLSDPYHFSKLFRRHVGIAPSEFRQRHGPFSRPPLVTTS